jgi:hypothetical protein
MLNHTVTHANDEKKEERKGVSARVKHCHDNHQGFRAAV